MLLANHAGDDHAGGRIGDPVGVDSPSTGRDCMLIASLIRLVGVDSPSTGREQEGLPKGLGAEPLGLLSSGARPMTSDCMLIASLIRLGAEPLGLLSSGPMRDSL